MKIINLEPIIKEYKRAREQRNEASARNDLQAVSMYNDSLNYWTKQVNKGQVDTGLSIEEVRKMLRSN